VAITIETYTARRAYEIAAAYRARGIPVVAGGYHPTFLPGEALEHVDAVVCGDAEEVWPDVVEDARRHRLARRYAGTRQPPLAGVRFDRRIFRGKRYPAVAAVQYGRGCRYACDFCSIHAFYGSHVRHRPVAEVAGEIAAAGRRAVLLVDDNLFLDRPRAEELFRALTPLGVRWGCQVSLDVADDGRLLRLMAKSGCVAALVGFESLESGSLRQMSKAWNLRRPFADAVRRFHDHGIMIYGSFIFGYDADTRETIARTVDFALDSKLFLVNFSPLTPTPGSRLYERLRAEGRLVYDRWWLDSRYRYGDATYRPRHMSPAELTASCAEARRTFYSRASIARRLTNVSAHLRSPWHLGLFLAANLTTRRELAAKLGHPLGAPDVPAGSSASLVHKESTSC
jgi:radical SAM superfamily enzyme YgiQ (UPF0313 family)